MFFFNLITLKMVEASFKWFFFQIKSPSMKKIAPFMMTKLLDLASLLMVIDEDVLLLP